MFLHSLPLQVKSAQTFLERSLEEILELGGVTRNSVTWLLLALVSCSPDFVRVLASVFSLEASGWGEAPFGNIGG